MLPSAFNGRLKPSPNTFFKCSSFFSSDPFYNDHVKLPLEDAPVPPEILNNPKFHPFFDDTLGAMDSTHFNCCPSAAEQQALRDRKGAITQNCLAICSFDMKFLCFFWLGGFRIRFDYVS